MYPNAITSTQMLNQHRFHGLLSLDCQNSVGNARFFTKTGQWTTLQKQKYLLFLTYHQDTFQNCQEKKLKQLFMIMSKYISSRKPNQCRLHHLKMEKYYRSPSNIIKHLSLALYPQDSEDELKIEEEQQIKVKLSQSFDGYEAAIMPSLEEKNEENIQNVGVFKRKERKKTSIKLNNEEEQIEEKEQQLPKTDLTINNFPSIPDVHRSSAAQRPDILSNFEEHQQSLTQNQIPLMNTFFSFSRNSASSIPTSRQFSWQQCQALFLSWLQSLSRMSTINY